MSVKKIYVGVFLLAVLSFGFQFIRDPVVYSLYGYSPDIIGGSSFESYQAPRDTYIARTGIVIGAIAIDFVCFILSLVVIFLRLKVNRFFAYIACGVSLFLLLLYGIAYTIPVGGCC
jgi:hypothetical protein